MFDAKGGPIALSSTLARQIPICNPLNIDQALSLIELHEELVKDGFGASTTASASGDVARGFPQPASPQLSRMGAQPTYLSVTPVTQVSHNHQFDWDESHLEALEEVKIFRSLH